MHESGGKLVVGVVMAGILVVFGFRLIADLDVQRERERAYRERQEKIKQARDLIARATNCPQAQFVDVLDEPDPWGHDLVVRKSKGAVQSVKIVCLGPDGVADTTDDIAGYRSLNIDWEQTGENLGEAGAELGKGVQRGIMQSLTRKEAKKKGD
ncbi:MAG: hypothetical protein AB7K24_22275 [Gemmataceae bacterium]